MLSVSSYFFFYLDRWSISCRQLSILWSYLDITLFLYSYLYLMDSFYYSFSPLNIYLIHLFSLKFNGDHSCVSFLYISWFSWCLSFIQLWKAGYRLGFYILIFGLEFYREVIYYKENSKPIYLYLMHHYFKESPIKKRQPRSRIIK